MGEGGSKLFEIARRHLWVTPKEIEIGGNYPNLCMLLSKATIKDPLNIIQPFASIDFDLHCFLAVLSKCIILDIRPFN